MKPIFHPRAWTLWPSVALVRGWTGWLWEIQAGPFTWVWRAW